MKIERGALGTDISGKNRSYRNTRMVVVRKNRAICRAPLYQMPYMEERKKEAN